MELQKTWTTPIGLAVFAALATLFVWYGAISEGAANEIELRIVPGASSPQQPGEPPSNEIDEFQQLG